MNPLLKLKELGQSIWLDYIQRNLLVHGDVARMIDHDGLAGVTSNPTIFEKAINEHHDYDEAIADLSRSGAAANNIYETLILEDVGRAADLFRSVYEKSNGRDGFVSIEVSPHLAYDTERTVTEAKRLWGRLGRPNIMIKVPGTRAGLPAVTRLIADGVNVNVTLLFGLEQYREVAQAYLLGLEERVAANAPLEGVASVASFFLSRIDTLVDERLDGLSGTEPDAARLRGEAAVALARLAYQVFKEMVAGDRWRALSARGARSQRLLWASTGTKDPRYSDVKYVDALIGPETVNTLTPETFVAYRDHGVPAIRLEQDPGRAQALPDVLSMLGIKLEDVSAQLEVEGVRKFVASFDKLLGTLERKRSQLVS